MHMCIGMASGNQSADYACHALAGPNPSRHTAAMENLKKLRKKAGLSQAKLAEMAGVDQSFVSRLERSQTDVSSDILRALASALKVPVSALFPPDSKQSRLWNAVERVPPGYEEQAAALVETFLTMLPKPQPKD